MENEHVQHVNTIGSRRYLCVSVCVCVGVSAHAKSVNRHNKTLNELKKAFYV